MNSRLEHGSLVTVLGGSGFVGRYAVQGARGRRLAHPRGDAPARSCRSSAAHGRGGANPARAGQPALSRTRCARAVEGADAVVNLVGILVKSGRADVPRRARGRRPGGRQGGQGGRRQDASCTCPPSARTASPGPSTAAPRRPARRPCWRSFPNAVILRPSLVFGPEDQLFNRFAAMARCRRSCR